MIKEIHTLVKTKKERGDMKRIIIMMKRYI